VSTIGNRTVCLSKCTSVQISNITKICVQNVLRVLECKLEDVDATAWSLRRWTPGGNVPTLRSGQRHESGCDTHASAATPKSGLWENSAMIFLHSIFSSAFQIIFCPGYSVYLVRCRVERHYSATKREIQEAQLSLTNRTTHLYMQRFSCNTNVKYIWHWQYLIATTETARSVSWFSATVGDSEKRRLCRMASKGRFSFMTTNDREK